MRGTPEACKVGFAGLLFVLSGASALIYQVAWQRILVLHTGVGLYSVATIVAAFLAGLGLGSHLGGRVSTRTSATTALRVFALLEMAIGLFGAVSPRLYYDWLDPWASRLPSHSWQGAVVHVVALLPPTMAMGMSLPVLVRGLVRRVETAGRTIGSLYGANLLGAGLGALATPWLLIPGAGIRGAILAAALGNAAAGIGALLLSVRQRAIVDDNGEAAAPALPPPVAEAPGRRPFALWIGLYTFSGFGALSLEMVWFRLLDVAVKSTAFTFGTVLAVYLLGSAVGCFLGTARVARIRRPLRTFLLCQCAILGFAALSVIGLALAPTGMRIYRWLFQYWANTDFMRFGRSADFVPVTRLYGVLPAYLFALPAVLMGFSFPVLQRAVQDEVRTAGRKVGALQAANTAGCVAGSLFVGLIGLRVFGTTGTLRLLVALGLLFAITGWRFYGRGFVAVAVSLLVLVVAIPGPERLWGRLHGVAQPGSGSIFEEDGTSLMALTPAPWGFRVSVNGKGNSWLPFNGIHTMLGALPAVVHPAPRDVAIIGLGSGDTAWAAGCRRETRSVTVFELSAPQSRALQRLSAREALPDLTFFLADPRARIRVADGRHALQTEDARYDMIESDATWPECAYSTNVYSLEFFTLVASRLRPGGVMCTWAPTRRVYHTFRSVFPHVVEVEGGMILLGSREPLPLDPLLWRERLEAARGYLGPERVVQVEESLASCALAVEEPGEDVNRDLTPRDEFARW